MSLKRNFEQNKLRLNFDFATKFTFFFDAERR